MKVAKKTLESVETYKTTTCTSGAIFKSKQFYNNIVILVL